MSTRPLKAWVEQDYHRKVHREINTTPLARMLGSPDAARPAPASEFFKLCFTHRISRCPRRSDATIVVDGIRYELPARFSHMRQVILRAPGWDNSQMILVDPDRDRWKNLCQPTLLRPVLLIDEAQ